jgi:hypothetical protein
LNGSDSIPEKVAGPNDNLFSILVDPSRMQAHTFLQEGPPQLPFQPDLPLLPDPRIPSFGRIIPHRHIDYAKHMDKIEPVFQFLEAPGHLSYGTSEKIASDTGIEANTLRD